MLPHEPRFAAALNAPLATPVAASRVVREGGRGGQRARPLLAVQAHFLQRH